VLILLLLIGALLALDVLAGFFGADSRPSVSDDHVRGLSDLVSWN
jgi:hypothetical protein